MLQQLLYCLRVFMYTNQSLGKYYYDSKCFRVGIDNIKAYEGVIKDTGNLIYIKLIPFKNSSCVDSKQLSNEVANEIQFLSHVRHRYIQNLVELFESENYKILVTEREPVNLQYNLHQIKGDKKIFDIFMDVVIGVCVLRTYGYLHTNLVASQIQIGQKNVKIGGFSAIFNQQKLRKGVKVLNTTRNLQQLAPQLLKEKCFTEKSMVWSLGVILYKLIYKKNPFSSKSKYEQLTKIQLQKKKFQNCHQVFKLILKGCLKPKLEQRFNLVQLLSCLLTKKQVQQAFGSILKQKLKPLKQSYRLPEASIAFQEQDKKKQIQNQINFVLFLERVCFLVQKAQVKIENPPILSLTQYLIRCRIQKLKKDPYWKQDSCSLLFKDELNQLQKQHKDKKYAWEQKFFEKQEYKLFKTEDYRYREIVYMQYQVYLREYIRNTINIIEIRTSKDLWIFRYTIHAINFIISLFELESDIIGEVQKHNWSKLSYNCLEEFSQNPLQYDVNTIYSKLVQKIKKYGLHVNPENL